jgi:biotin carboxyl carrier protein
MSSRRTATHDPDDGTSIARPGTLPEAPAADRIVDPRAVRVALGLAAAHADMAPIVIEPAVVPLAPAPRVTGTGLLGGVAAPRVGRRPDAAGPDEDVVIDGDAAQVTLGRLGPIHAVLVEGRDEPLRTNVLLMPVDGPSPGGSAGPAAQRQASGIVRREVVVDGWRIEVELESERRASLRERARRGREGTARGGPTEVRAIIPGQVVSVSIVPGDAVVAGQQLLVVEAMKMQNELRAPRDGEVSRVAVGAGQTIEVGDLLLVLD